MEMTSKIQENF